jgi:hypothetical protein
MTRQSESAATPATPSEECCVAEKTEQNQQSHTCHTCHLAKASISEQNAQADDPLSAFRSHLSGKNSNPSSKSSVASVADKEITVFIDEFLPHQSTSISVADPLIVPTLDDVAERIGSWLKIADNPPRHSTKTWKDLADETSDFALSVWAYPAIMTGWGDGALFALDEGLIPEKLRRRFHWMKVDADAATVMNSKGEIEHFRRPRTTSPPWWNN